MSVLTSADRRSVGRLLAWTIAIVAMVVVGAFHDSLGQPLTLLLLSVAAAAAMAACTAWFIGLDEVAQRAHYVAWFWGGSLGLLIMGAASIGAVALGWARSDQIAAAAEALGARPDAGGGFLVGLAFALLPMMLGYALWWTAYWLRRR